MLLKIIWIIIIVNISQIQCKEDDLQYLGKLNNLTIKFGNKTEIHFEIKDFCSKTLLTQMETLRIELANLAEKFDNVSLNTLQSNQFPKSCAEATALTRRSGAYQIQLPGHSTRPILVSCDEDTQGGGWTIVLQRLDGSINFYRYWQDYKTGFGNVNGEFFIGLDLLHELTKNHNQELLIVMENMAGETKFSKYDRFVIGNETDLYVLRTLGEYSGDAGDSLVGHLGNNFSSRDRDNDMYDGNCAQMYTGAWWYNKCHTSNLMGKYNDSTYGKGINWFTFAGHNASLKQVKMMIRQTR